MTPPAARLHASGANPFPVDNAGGVDSQTQLGPVATPVHFFCGYGSRHRTPGPILWKGRPLGLQPVSLLSPDRERMPVPLSRAAAIARKTDLIRNIGSPNLSWSCSPSESKVSPRSKNTLFFNEIPFLSIGILRHPKQNDARTCARAIIVIAHRQCRGASAADIFCIILARQRCGRAATDYW